MITPEERAQMDAKYTEVRARQKAKARARLDAAAKKALPLASPQHRHDVVSDVMKRSYP